MFQNIFQPFDLVSYVCTKNQLHKADQSTNYFFLWSVYTSTFLYVI